MADDTELVEADDEDIEGAVAELGGSEGAESPDELGHESGPDGYDDVADEVLSESEAEGQDGQPRGPDGKFIAKPDQPAAAAVPDAPAAPTDAVPVVDPFAGFNPFAFKVDGTEI